MGRGGVVHIALLRDGMSECLLNWGICRDVVWAGWGGQIGADHDVGLLCRTYLVMGYVGVYCVGRSAVPT